MVNTKPLLALSFLGLVGACSAGELDDGAASQGAALSLPVRMVLEIHTTSRRLGSSRSRSEPAQCCSVPNVPFADCPSVIELRRTRSFDRRGAFHKEGEHASGAETFVFNGPHSCSNGEWSFSGIAEATRSDIVARLDYRDVNPERTFAPSTYVLAWKARDSDESYSWEVRADKWLNDCLRASNKKDGTFTVDAGSFNGALRASYTVSCAVTGNPAVPAPAPEGNAGGPPAGTANPGTGGNDGVCFPSYDECAAACSGACQRKINCGGGNAHKCFE
jgi:hypothetical protein